MQNLALKQHKKDKPLLAQPKQRSFSRRFLHCCKLLLGLVPLKSTRSSVTSCSEDKISSVAPLEFAQVTLFDYIAALPWVSDEGTDQMHGSLAAAEEFFVRIKRSHLHTNVVAQLATTYWCLTVTAGGYGCHAHLLRIRSPSVVPVDNLLHILREPCTIVWGRWQVRKKQSISHKWVSCYCDHRSWPFGGDKAGGQNMYCNQLVIIWHNTGIVVVDAFKECARHWKEANLDSHF